MPEFSGRRSLVGALSWALNFPPARSGPRTNTNDILSARLHPIIGGKGGLEFFQV